jgi:hypothetical protein
MIKHATWYSGSMLRILYFLWRWPQGHLADLSPFDRVVRIFLYFPAPWRTLIARISDTFQPREREGMWHFYASFAMGISVRYRWYYTGIPEYCFLLKARRIQKCTHENSKVYTTILSVRQLEWRINFLIIGQCSPASLGFPSRPTYSTASITARSPVEQRQWAN